MRYNIQGGIQYGGDYVRLTKFMGGGFCPPMQILAGGIMSRGDFVRIPPITRLWYTYKVTKNKTHWCMIMQLNTLYASVNPMQCVKASSKVTLHQIMRVTPLPPLLTAYRPILALRTA